MHYIDLTHTFKSKMPVYPGDTPPVLEQVDFINECGCNAYRVTTGMHVGTHMDSPLHMIDGGKKLNEYPPEHFFGNGHLIDARGKTIEAKLLDSKEIKKGDIVLVMTGFADKFEEPEYYADYPEIEESFALRLVELGVHAVGMDTPSPDRPPFDIHKILLSRDVLIIENLTNLESLIGIEKFNVCALPTKFEAEAAPTRVVVEINN